jgi:hypothetical protein
MEEKQSSLEYLSAKRTQSYLKRMNKDNSVVDPVKQKSTFVFASAHRDFSQNLASLLFTRVLILGPIERIQLCL